MTGSGWGKITGYSNANLISLRRYVTTLFLLLKWGRSNWWCEEGSCVGRASDGPNTTPLCIPRWRPRSLPLLTDIGECAEKPCDSIREKNVRGNSNFIDGLTSKASTCPQNIKLIKKWIAVLLCCPPKGRQVWNSMRIWRVLLLGGNAVFITQGRPPITDQN